VRGPRVASRGGVKGQLQTNPPIKNTIKRNVDQTEKKRGKKEKVHGEGGEDPNWKG